MAQVGLAGSEAVLSPGWVAHTEQISVFTCVVDAHLKWITCGDFDPGSNCMYFYKFFPKDFVLSFYLFWLVLWLQSEIKKKN